jgi:hypothetical protein
LPDFQAAGIHPLFLGKFFPGGGEPAILVGHLHWRPLHLQSAIRLLGGQPLQQNRQAARRTEKLHLLRLQMGLRQRGRDPGSPLLQSRIHKTGWELFTADFQQIGNHTDTFTLNTAEHHCSTMQR